VGVDCDENNCLPGAGGGDDEESFIQMLKGSRDMDYCDDVIAQGLDEFAACKGKDVWYNAELDTVLFSRPTDPIQEIDLEPEKDFITVVFDYLRNILLDLLDIAGLAQKPTESAQQNHLAFIEKAGSFDKLYISSDPDSPTSEPRQIRAIRETRAYTVKVGNDIDVKYRNFLSAEYLNYPVDTCQFFYRHTTQELRDQISANDIIRCTPVILDDDQWMYSVYVEEPLFNIPSKPEELRARLAPVRVWLGTADNFWNDITAKIRTQPTRTLPISALTTPAFITEPENDPVAGFNISFNLTNGPADGERWIATTWDFGDGFRSSSAFNVSVTHRYSDSSPEGEPYQVRLCVMNEAYDIACTTKPLPVKSGPAVEIFENQQTEDKTANLTFRITGGNPPFSMQVFWNDSGAAEGADRQDVIELDDIEWSPAPYTYSDSLFEGAAVKRVVTVTGADRDGVQFENRDEISVSRTVLK
jgi:hypothetical protein